MKCPHRGGEVSPPASSPRWRVGEDGVIYFSVTSDGTTGEEWIARLEGKGDHFTDCAKSVLYTDDFEPTSGVTTEVVVLPGWLWGEDTRTAKNVRAKARKRKLGKLNAEVACLIRDTFTDEELAAMGFWLVIVMHKPINNGGDSCRLGVGRLGGSRRVSACSDAPRGRWYRDIGFAFAVPAK